MSMTKVHTYRHSILYITTVGSVKQGVRNWSKNRPCDPSKVEEICASISTTNEQIGIIYVWYDDNWFNVFDGWNRWNALKNFDDTTILLQVYTCSEKDIELEFQTLNKANSVPDLYFGNDDLKKKICEAIVLNLCSTYPANVSANRKHQVQNFNKYNLIDFISTFNIDFSDYIIVDKILIEWNNINSRTKKSLLNTTVVHKKNIKSDCFWVYLDKRVIKKRIETKFAEHPCLENE